MHGDRQSAAAPTGTGAPRVLFVSHEATRTGAPVMFLSFLRWLRANTRLEMEILLLAGGPLADEFAKVAPTTLVEARGSGGLSYVEAGISRAGFPRVSDRMKVSRTQRAVRDLRGFDALYLNSTTSALALRILPEIPPVVLSHVHELGSAFTYWFPEVDRAALLAATHRFITCADVVSRHLMGAWGVPGTDIARHYEFVDPPKPDPERAPDVRRSLGIPEGVPVIGGAGQLIWRKAPDLFLQVAATLTRRRPDLDAHFLWVGGGVGDETLPVVPDIQRLGLDGRVHLAGEVADPTDLLALFDLFCLPSREDPYPLVMLETAALGTPVVGFANGGVVEFAGDQSDPYARRGVIVPYLDVEAMADALAGLLDDEVERAAVGARGQERVLHEHTVEVAAVRLYQELMDALSGLGRGTRRDPLPVGARVLAAIPTRQDLDASLADLADKGQVCEPS